MPPGITPRHKRACGSHAGGGCSCSPSFQAMAWSARDNKPVRRTFGSLSEAKRWCQEAQVALRRGTIGGPVGVFVREAAEEWVRAADAGVVRAGGGYPYKPSALRTYKEALYQRLLPRFGHLRLSALTRNHVQRLVDDLVVEG